MFSRAVDPKADAGRIAAVLTRTTIAVAVVTAIPAFILGPRLVRFVYGAAFADAGVALRLILPGRRRLQRGRGPVPLHRRAAAGPGPAR